MFAKRLICSLVCAQLALSPTCGVWAARELATESLNLNLPSMGAVAGTELSPAEEQTLGEQMMRQIRSDPSYLNDAETLEYLNRLGYKLVSVTDTHTYNFFFYPLIDRSLNAFAIPGGFIAVHSGLIIAAQSESELAGVISHEIGHVTQRHIARMIDAQKGNAALSLGSFLLALLAARAGSGQAASALAIGGQAALIQNQLSYSRGAEREADRVGLTSDLIPKAWKTFSCACSKTIATTKRLLPLTCSPTHLPLSVSAIWKTEPDNSVFIRTQTRLISN